MSEARIGYVGGAHLCIKAVGITIIIVITGTIPHFLLWVVYRKKTQGNSKKRRGSADLRRIDADKKKRRGKRPHGKVKCHAALKVSVCPMGCGQATGYIIKSVVHPVQSAQRRGFRFAVGHLY